MVAGAAAAGKGGVCSAVLGFLLAPAFAGHLGVAAAEDGVEGAAGDGDVGGGGGGGPLFGDVVVELCRGPFAGGVVEHAAVGDGGEGDAGVDFEGLPGEEAVAELVGEDGGVGGGEVSFLGDFAGDLVLAVAVGDAADEGGGRMRGRSRRMARTTS